MEPLGKFGEEEEAKKSFPPIKSGHQVQAELNIIKLGSPDKILAS